MVFYTLIPDFRSSVTTILFSKCYNVHVTLKIFLISLLASGDDVPFRVYCVASISWS
ncbi:hypothetical protein M6B38_337545 [Iris pallida]|uniref:Uncharacterized protein n=1 Tax=Iris pallida TaxID=29817 RepID=A0AAX6DTD7_IRIPA|nr:hypothetical protein M6B38_229095 [Iris pallida]KAJ6834057.1 hypothetical protein M6B38_337545 [Iris pallida]